MIKKILFLSLIGITFFSGYSYGYTVGQTAKLLKEKNVSIVYNKRVLTEVPSWIQKTNDMSTVSTGSSYWLKRLPSQDTKVDIFIVIPQRGIVAPIIIPSAGVDYNYLVQRNIFDYLPFLQQGVLRFPTTTPLGLSGNSVLFGHSSYRKSATGSYNTIFMLLPLIEKGEEIWIYRLDKNEVYQRMIYKVSRSYETTKEDTNVMNKFSTKKKYLTLSTCVPIGTANKRRIVRAINTN